MYNKFNLCIMYIPTIYIKIIINWHKKITKCFKEISLIFVHKLYIFFDESLKISIRYELVEDHDILKTKNASLMTRIIPPLPYKEQGCNYFCSDTKHFL